MAWYGILSGVLLLLASVFLVIVVVLQESKTNMSGAVSGATDSYVGKGKSMTRDLLLSKMTKYVAIGFFVVVIGVNVVQLLI